MKKPKRQRPEEEERPAEPQGRVGGGPDAPGGDTEPSNWPGETRARGMRPPDPIPAVPELPGEVE